MAAASDYLEWQVLSHLLGSGTFSKPSVIAIALCSGEPADARTGATIPELPNQGAYARQTLNPSADRWLDPVGADGVCRNHQDATFPIAQSDWGWVSGVAICDSATYGAGNMLMHLALTVPKLIGSGDRLVLSSGNMVFTMA